MRTTALILCVVAGASVGVQGFEPQTDTAPLGGPKVETVQTPGGSSFGEPQKRERAQQEMRNRIAAAEVRRAVEEGLPDDLDLTEAQREQITVIFEEHKAAMQAFMAEHREELQALRKEAGEAAGPLAQRLGRRGEGRGQGGGEGERRRAGRGGGGQGDDGPGSDAPAMDEPGMDGPGMEAPAEFKDGARNAERRPGAGPAGGQGARRGAGNAGAEPTPEQLAAREKLQALMQNAPKIDEPLKRAMSVLNEPQRAFIEDRIETRVAELRERMAERQAERGAGQGRPGGEDGRPNLENMTPEQREQLKQRIQERRGERANPGEDKPAPSIDSVDVPDPD